MIRPNVSDKAPLAYSRTSPKKAADALAWEAPEKTFVGKVENARPRFPRLTLTTPACVTVDVIGRVEISHLGKLCRLLTNPQRCPLRPSSRLAAPCVEREWSWQAESRALTARRNMFLNAQSANSPKRKSAVTRPTPGAIAPPGRDECSRQRDHPSTV
jgi:hypothetical protein